MSVPSVAAARAVNGELAQIITEHLLTLPPVFHIVMKTLESVVLAASLELWI
jgi:hypothetical protein